MEKLSEYVKVAEAAEILGVAQATFCGPGQRTERSPCTKTRPMAIRLFVSADLQQFLADVAKRSSRNSVAPEIPD
ncbi:MAG: MerR family DNA-binding transcriptional regulator [Pirellulaceae bacterium]